MDAIAPLAGPLAPLGDFRLRSALALDEAALRGALRGRTGREQAEVLAAQVERAFVQVMMSELRKTVPEGGLLGRGLGGRHFLELLDQEYARLAAENLRFDFHESLVRQIVDAGADPRWPGSGETAKP
jgi:Rod binding domain-containing protein